MKTKALGFHCLLICLGSWSWAATSEDVLKTAWKDQNVEASKKAVSLSTEANSWNPIWESQLKFEKGEFNGNGNLVGDEQKYEFRLYPKGFTEYKTASRFQKVMEQHEKSIYKQTLSSSLSSRYNLLARAVMLKEKKEISKQLSDLAKKSEKAFSYMAQRDRAELKNFLKIKNDFQKTSLKLADIERDYSQADDEIKKLGLGTLASLQTNDVMPVSEIVNEIPEIEKKASEDSLSAKITREGIDRSSAATSFENARDSRWIDYVEFVAAEDRRERLYSFAIAFNLPFLSAPDPRTTDDETDNLRTRAKDISATGEANQLFKNSVSELKTLVELHKTLEKAAAIMSPDRLRATSKAIAGQDPILALDLQRGWHEAREQMLDLEYRIRVLYIACLHEASIIGDDPEVNYFSRSKKKVL